MPGLEFSCLHSEVFKDDGTQLTPCSDVSSTSSTADRDQKLTCVLTHCCAHGGPQTELVDDAAWQGSYQECLQGLQAFLQAVETFVQRYRRVSFWMGVISM